MNEYIAGMLTILLFYLVGDLIGMINDSIKRYKHKKELKKLITKYENIYLGPTSDRIEIGSAKFGK